MANNRSNDHSDPWPAMVWLGLICGIAVGALLMMLRRRDEGGGGGNHQLASGNDDLALGLGPDLLATARIDPLMPVAPAMNAISPLARTTYIGTTNPTFLFRANGPRDWEVRVRVLGPPGSSATFLYSGSSADQFVVPAGAHDVLRLPGYQSLYAVGSTSGVSVSASGGEVTRA